MILPTIPHGLITTISLVNVYHLIKNKIKETEKKFFSMWWELLVFALLKLSYIAHSSVTYINHSTNTYLPYNWKFLPFDRLPPIPLPFLPPLNHKSDPSMSLFLWRIIDLQHVTGSKRTTQWFSVSRHCKSFTRKANTFQACLLTVSEKAVAPHSSTLAWKIPWTEEPGGLPSVGSHRVGHNWSDLAAVAA